jgi:hypothetical protein
MHKYAIGGLEPNENDKNIVMKIDDVNYLLTDKFKSQLRNSILDWGTFLEIYNDNITYNTLFDQVTKLLDIKSNENVRDILLPIVKNIYSLPIDAHLACMMKQFMIYEPVSHSIYHLFTIIKRHFEKIVERFIKVRNNYITANKLHANINDWETLQATWNKLNDENSLDSSSVILLFLNPPKGLKSHIHYKTPGKENIIDNLKKEINNFRYMGFCPKVPHERLAKLLLFPLDAFILAIKAFDSTAKFPNYSLLESNMEKIFKNAKNKPIVKDDIIRAKPPKDLLKAIKRQNAELTPDNEKKESQAKLLLIRWYVDKIMDLRKSLLSYGLQYEEYYISLARLVNEIAENIKKDLVM